MPPVPIIILYLAGPGVCIGVSAGVGVGVGVGPGVCIGVSVGVVGASGGALRMKAAATIKMSITTAIAV